MGELNLDGEERRLSTEVKMDLFFSESLSKKDSEDVEVFPAVWCGS